MLDLIIDWLVTGCYSVRLRIHIDIYRDDLVPVIYQKKGTTFRDTTSPLKNSAVFFVHLQAIHKALCLLKSFLWRVCVGGGGKGK